MKKLTVVVLGLVAPVRSAFAHGGGLDRYGCHKETRAGGYHCHKARKRKEDQENLLKIILTGGAVAIVIYAVHRAHKNQKGAVSSRGGEARRVGAVDHTRGRREHDPRYAIQAEILTAMPATDERTE